MSQAQVNEAEGLEQGTEGGEYSEDFDLDYGESSQSASEPEGTQEGQQSVAEPPLETPQDGQPQPQSQEQPQPESTQTQENLQAPQTSDVELLQSELNKAYSIINSYQQRELEQKAFAQQQAQQQPQAQQLQKTQPGEVQKLDFLQGQDHIEILQDANKFNDLLANVATVAFTAAVNAAQERVMRSIPSIVQASSEQQTAIANITRDFYEKNADLSNFRPAVSMAAMQLFNENPSMQLPELLSKAAERTREILHIKGVQQQRTRRPAQPAGRSVRSAGGNRAPAATNNNGLTDQEQQILDLLTF